MSEWEKREIPYILKWLSMPKGVSYIEWRRRNCPELGPHPILDNPFSNMYLPPNP